MVANSRQSCQRSPMTQIAASAQTRRRTSKLGGRAPVLSAVSEFRCIGDRAGNTGEFTSACSQRTRASTIRDPQTTDYGVVRTNVKAAPLQTPWSVPRLFQVIVALPISVGLAPTRTAL